MPLVFARSILGFVVVADTGVTWADPDIANASYDSVSFSVLSQDGTATGVRFKDDGTKMYICGSASDRIHQYTLSTSWDVSTASYDSQSLDVSSEETIPEACFFKSDGTSVYVVGRNSDSVFQYDLTTAWDISTASYASKSMSVNSQEAAPRGLYFKDDGTKAYILGTASDTVYQYALSTAWDISTGAFETGKSVSVASEDTSPLGVYFNPDGNKMWIIGAGNDNVFQYSLSTAWDVSTASYDSVSFSVATEDTTPTDLTFKTDGSKMYIIGSSNEKVFQYSTVASAWTNPDLTTASYDSVSFSVATQDTFLHDFAFKDDGTKMYIMGAGNDSVFQYSLSTAWDVSTASYDSVSFSVNSEEGVPTSLFFKPDGSKFYIAGSGQDTVFQYSMSTSWDLSTASYESKSFSVTTQENNPRDVAFKTDGTKMYILGVTNDRIDEYSLSTAWDVSTASHTTNFSLASQDGNPQSLFFNPDGDKVWIVGSANNTAFQYSLSTAWDISTASYDSVSFSVSSQMTGASGIEFKSDGSKMYVSDIVNDVVYQYST